MKQRNRNKIRILSIGLMLIVIAVCWIWQGGGWQWEQPITAPTVRTSHLSSHTGTESVGTTTTTTSTATPVQTENWRLMLVNRSHPMPEGYQPSLADVDGVHQVDARILPYLQQMLEKAESDGIPIRVTSAYRTDADQQQMMDEKIAEYLAQGYGSDEAEQLAEETVALPGTSEHQLGLAVDLSTADWNAMSAQEVWDWLAANCSDFGFILRYPADKTDLTGIAYEPWHFRYVGEDAAAIMESGLCLEEFLALP